MDTALFLTQLPYSLNDPENQIYSAALCQTSMVLAVRAYRRWRPLLRPFGAGNLYSAATAGSNVIQAVGGPWAVGETVQIVDQFSSETFTIQSLAAGALQPNWMGTPIAITLSGNLANSHVAGAYVGGVPAGLTIVAGTQLYALPLDFVSFDQLTWDLANGSRYAVKNYEYFYDGVWVYSQMLSGIGFSQSQTFMSSTGGGWPYGGFVGIPDGTGFNQPTCNSSETVFEVMPGNPPVLYMNPPQNQNGIWQFNYYAGHQPETVPDSAFDAVMDASMAVAIEAVMQGYGGLIDGRDIMQAMSPSNNIEALLKVAQNALAQFDIKVRKLPLLITGVFVCVMWLTCLI